MRRVALILLIGVWIGVVPAAAQPPKTGQWEPFEVTMSGSADFANAYVDGLPDGGKPFVVVTFTGTSGYAKGLSYAVPGFWDGGQAWKARFAAPAAGEWSYAAFSTDPVLRGVKGSFHCAEWRAGEKAANPTRHGFVRVAKIGPRAGRYFEYHRRGPRTCCEQEATRRKIDARRTTAEQLRRSGTGSGRQVPGHEPLWDLRPRRQREARAREDDAHFSAAALRRASMKAAPSQAARARGPSTFVDKSDSARRS
jgi:hypothetical protein